MEKYSPRRGSSENENFLEQAMQNSSKMPKERQRASKRKSRRKSLIAVGISLAIVLGGGSFAFVKAMEFWRANAATDYPGPGSGEVVVSIQQGWTAREIGDELVNEDVVASQKAFVRAAKRDERSNTIQVGSYKMLKQMKAEDALEILIDPSNRLRDNITFREGLRNTQVANLISENLGVSYDEVNTAMESSEIGLPSYAQSAEGYLFPQTYDYSLDPSPTGILKQMTEEFASNAAQLDLEKKADELGYSPHEIVTIASIIEKEIRHPEQAPDVAQVIYNRLKDGMKLRMDSTVHYAVGDSGETVMTSDEQRNIDSPYNTYKYEGLPPGPICNPGRTALEAALNPSKGNYMFFVTVNMETGETRFAETDEEHLKNVKIFQQYCRDHDGC